MHSQEYFENGHNKPTNAITIELRETLAGILRTNGVEVNPDDIIAIRSNAIRLLKDKGMTISDDATLYEIYDACMATEKIPTFTH